ncbi:MAG: fimbrial protein [Tannerellaceae bacterium]|nr:fimbrial protein [Tannerellaceae bacterium]
MKIKNYLLSGLIVLGGLVFTSCSDNEGLPGDDGLTEGEANITIKLGGSTPATPFVKSGDNTDSDIYDYKVYVFNATNGILEKEVVGKIDGNTTIEKLGTATPKKVVVLANLGNKYPIGINNYAQLSDEENYSNLLNQIANTADNGFVMSGQYPTNIVLTKDEHKKIEVFIKRTMAKVILGSITFMPEEGHELDKLEILGVAVQRVTPDATLAPIAGIYGNKHYGGFESADNELEVHDLFKSDIDYSSFHKDEQGKVEINKPNELNIPFFVFPNNNPEKCTLLTIKAKYENGIHYFPVKVNHADGEYVDANTQYTVNLTLKKFGDGTTDPELPNEEASLEVEIEVAGWTLITQDEEW